MLAERLFALVSASEAAASSREPPQFKVVVTNAHGESSEAVVGPGEYVMGSDPLADLVVLDSEADALMLLRVDERPNGSGVIAVPLTQGLRVNDRVLESGAPVALGPQALILAGPVNIQVRSTAPARPGLALPLGLAFGGGALAVLALTGLFGTESDPAERPAVTQNAAAAEHAPLGAAAAAEDMKARLGGATLGAGLYVQVDGERLLVRGTTSLEDAGKLKDIIDVVGRRDGVAIATDLSIPPGAVSPALAAVALAPRAYVVTQDGRRLQVGDRLDDGSRISAISASAVQIDREGVALRVKF